MKDTIKYLRKHLMESKLFYKTWPNIRLFQFYILSIPDWIRWQKNRRKKRQIYLDIQRHTEKQLQIFFVTDLLSARELKVAYSVKQSGHRVNLITVSNRLQTPPPMMFDLYKPCKNPWQALGVLDEQQPDTIHVFVHIANSYLIPILLYSNAPIIYDPYDCKRGFISPDIYYFERLSERAFIERSNHICSRSLEPLFLRRKYGYNLPGTTYFPEYCWNSPALPKIRKITNDDELKVVYGGGVMPEDRFPPKIYGYAQYIEIGRSLANQRIHLHIYPAPIKDNFDDYFSIYIKESLRNPYFHIHRSLPNQDWIEELSRFDAALHVFGISINGKFDYANEAKQNYSSANKLIDYLEAGLPVLIHGGFHQFGLLRHYRQAVRITNINEAREKLIDHINNPPVINLKSATLGYQGYRLTDMYNNVIMNQPTNTKKSSV